MMASGASGEVVRCPNCNEDVPKTLYCLNCGFPLYKEEQVKEAKPEPKRKEEITPMKSEPITSTEDAVIVVDDGLEMGSQEPNAEPTAEATHEPALEGVRMAPSTEETIAQQVEPVESTATMEVKTVEARVEVKEPEAPMPEVSTPTVAEIPRPPIVEMATPMTTNEPSPGVGKAPSEEVVEMVEEYEEETMKKGYVPDPLSKELMENLAKSISLKLKLVKLYREGMMKEETFNKLFDGYLSEGKVWSTRRDEILSKLSVEVEEMEEAYVNAVGSLELLEIKKSIGEISDDEYAAKAPAYKWDIHQFDFVVAEKRNKISYLENIGVVLSTEELRELRGLASIQYNTIDALQITSEEGLVKVKQSLYDAIKTLG